MKTIAEQIQAFEAKLKSLEDKAVEIVQKSLDEARTLDKAEEESRLSAVNEAKSVRDHIAVLKQTEQLMIERAKTVNPDAGQAGAGSTGTQTVDVGNGTVRVKRNTEKGQIFHRVSVAMALAKGDSTMAIEIAKSRFADTPEVAATLKASQQVGGMTTLHEIARDFQAKAAVAFATTTDSGFVGPLVQYNDMEAEFIDLLRPATVIGKLNQLHRVPFMSRMGRQLTGVSGAFVGEGAPKPVGKQTYDNVTLGFAKAAIIVVMSDESVRFSSPNAETLARNDMVAGIATYLDKRFLDPAFSGVPGISPASITNGAQKIQSSGVTTAAIDADAKAALTAAYAGTDLSPATGVWVMSATTALGLSMRRGTQDQLLNPGLSMTGGTWYGLPVIVSNAMVASGSPGEKQILLLTQSEVLMADDGGVTLDMSREASVQMSDTPVGGAQSLVSLWQNNLLGIRAEQYINWAPARANSLGIVLIENTNY